MKSLLPLIACALIVGSCGATNFKLPPFEVFDKNNDGIFTDTEAGQLLIDTAKVLTQKAGKKLFRAIGAFREKLIYDVYSMFRFFLPPPCQDFGASSTTRFGACFLFLLSTV